MTHKLWRTFSELETVSTELDALTKLLGFLVTNLDDSAANVGDDPIRALGFTASADTFCTMLFAVCTGLDTQIAALTKNVCAGYDTIKAYEGGCKV